MTDIKSEIRRQLASLVRLINRPHLPLLRRVPVTLEAVDMTKGPKRSRDALFFDPSFLVRAEQGDGSAGACKNTDWKKFGTFRATPFVEESTCQLLYAEC